MKESWLKHNYRIIIIVAIELALISIFFICRYLFVKSDHPILLSLCDAFCMAGCIYILVSIIVFATSKGALDGFFYFCRIVANMFAKEKAMNGKPRYISYFDYLATIQRKKTHPRLFAASGAAAFLISLVLLMVYNS